MSELLTIATKTMDNVQLTIWGAWSIVRVNCMIGETGFVYVCDRVFFVCLPYRYRYIYTYDKW